MADRIAVMNAGRIEQAGLAAGIVSPSGQFVCCRFYRLAEDEFYRRRHCRPPWRGDFGSSAGASCGFRRQRRMAGDGEFLEHLGADTFAHIRADNIGRLTVRVGGDSPLQREEQVFLSPAPESLHRFDGEGNAVVG